MLKLYKEEPISISFLKSDRQLELEFCNVKMNLNPCQFKLFNQYLIRLQKGLDSDTKSVQINLVKDCLNIEISLKDFLQLCNGVETALINKFGYKPKIQN